ncbi:MAG: DegV family EDD domain-containing protein [Lachnospiraceae bacterium]|nr:DegV family EDD domain-containing protein [Lachnospiraceae bacterium]
MIINGPFKRLRTYLYNSDIDYKDRSFVVFSITVLIALFVAVPSGLAMGEPIAATISTLVGAILFSLYVIFSYKTNRIRSARIVISIVLIFIFQPVMFFTNGGVYGGAPIWLLLGSIYVVLIIDGIMQIVMIILNAVVNIACWIIGYHFPNFIVTYSRFGNYFDTLAAMIIVGGVIFILLAFQKEIYKLENDVAKEKTREVEELNRKQNRFFSSVSHEIRTPINTVLGLNEIILRQEDATPEILKDARNIQGAGRMLLALINDVLDISKIEAGKMEIIPVDYSVGNMVSELVNMVWLKAEQKGLEFKVNIDPTLPATLYGDEIRIKQILINILNNAVKYTHEGFVKLQMEYEPLDDDNIIFRAIISDSGTGIPQEALPHIFDSFQRVEEKKNRKIEGTGLGMSIVKNLVDLMGGTVTASSIYAQGSTFTVSLKQKIATDKKLGNIELSAGSAVTTFEKYEHSFFAPDARILIVDDNEMNLEVETKLLEGTEMTIDEATNGQEALEMTLKNKYDLIFMDHLMPVMDGIDAFKEIRNQVGGLNRDVPIVVLTANADAENILLYSETGFDRYVVKPVSGRQLEETILGLLPKEKLVLNENVELTGGRKNTASGYIRKKPVIITTNSLADLPESVVRDLQIERIPFTIRTDSGLFYDGVEAVSDEMIRYLDDGGVIAESAAPTEEEFMIFFAEHLQRAHHIIHITITNGISKEYERASAAAKAFGNVTIVDSGSLSNATGMLALIAAKLAKQGKTEEQIVEELEEAKSRLRCSFVVADTSYLTRRGILSSRMDRMLKSLWLRPCLKLNSDGFDVGKLLRGNLKRCYERYIKRALSINANPDTDLIFINYAEIAEEHLLWIADEIEKRVHFDHVVIQKASAGIAANCGPGTFGLLFMAKGEKEYHLGKMIERAENAYEEARAIQIIEENMRKEAEANKAEKSKADTGESEEVMTEEPKWYDALENLDVDYAIKNSGSEDLFREVLQIYYDSAKEKEEEIRRFYEAEDFENYTIKVHALKSSSRLIGAMELGDEAEKLEMAGKNADTEYIKANNDRVMEMLQSLVKELDVVCHKEEAEDESKPIAEDFIMESFYEMAKEAAEAEDAERMKDMYKEMEDYRIPDSEIELYNTIKENFDIMNYKSIITALEGKV